MQFKKLRGSKADQIPVDEPEELAIDPGAVASHASSAADLRRASEPMFAFKTSLQRNESPDRIPPPFPRHLSTSGASFLTVGSQPSRRNSGKRSVDPLGLTLVHECDNPVADLIFVHGLGGSSLRTWSYDRDVDNFWPLWLGGEAGLAETRVFTFGYNAHFAHQDTTLSILDFAKDLLFRAKMHQDRANENSRLIGEAYILGRTDDQYSEMISQTYGIVFLGTPHGGSSFASTLKNIIRATPTIGSKVYVNELEKGSAALGDINEQFRTVCGDLDLVSFYETLKTTISPGVKIMIVEKESAILGYPTETSAPLYADHHGIIKFPDPDDGNYRDVRNVLRMFVHRIKQLQKRSAKPKPAEILSPSPITLENVLGIKEVGSDLEVIRQRVQPGSCRWILEKKEFKRWTEDNSPGLSILWLTGLPATGKTTLSSFIIDYLSQGLFPASCQYHFFQAEQHDTRTPSYFLRSIAFQIAEVYDEFRSRLLEMNRSSGILLSSQKHNVIWEKIFEGLLFRLNLGEQLFWVLDGIDEAESPSTLVTLISKINSATPIKVILVSRETRDLSAALSFDHCQIYHEEIQTSDTMDDIRSYVSTTLHRILPDDGEQDSIIQKVLSKASGSFLWAKLALERIKDNWHTDADIERALAEMPEGMEHMYERMIRIVADQPTHLRKMATEILTWGVCSFRPLDIEELAVALKSKFGSFYNLKVTISQICGNFIITKKSSVTLIHQTAQQFLTSKDANLPISIDNRKGHERVARVCMDILSDTKWRTRFASLQQTRDSIQQDPYTEFPFLLYSVKYWAYHVSCASAESEELHAAVFDFLERFCLMWINAVALTGDLQIITRSAQQLKSYAKRTINRRVESPPTSFKSCRDQELIQWANDLIRLVGRFGSYLVESPSAIYKYIIPFCPSQTMLSQTFQHLMRGSMNVKGISSGNWDDCLARLTMGGDETASAVVCKDNYFITLLEGSGTLVIWIAETCIEYNKLHHNEWVSCIKAAKIRNIIASAGIETIRVWDIGLGNEILKIPKSHEGRVMALAFSSNDNELLVAYDDCTIQCIGLETSQELWCFEAYDTSRLEHSCPRFMVFSNDSKRIAIAYRGRPVFIWHISRRKQRPLRCIRQDDIYKNDEDVWNSPEAVIWQPDSANVLILYQDTKLVDWNIDDDTQTEHAHIGAREMAVSSDGNLLLTSDFSGSLSVWSTGQFRLIYQMKYDEFVQDIAFAPDAQRFYDIRGTLCNVWEPAALVRPDDLNREDMSSHDTLYSDPVVSSDDNSRVQISALVSSEKTLYHCSGKEDGSVVIYETQTSKRLRKLYGHSDISSVVSMAWSPSQKYIASADDSGRVIAKRLGKPTAQAPQKWAVYPLLDLYLEVAVTQLLFSASEEFLLISSSAMDALWSTKSKSKILELEHKGRSNGRRWIRHPKDAKLLICIQGNRQEIYTWSTLTRVTPPSSPKERVSLKGKVTEGLAEVMDNVSIRDTFEDARDVFPSMNTLFEAPDHVFQIKDRYIVVGCTVYRGSGDDSRLYPTSSRRVEIIDTTDAQLRRKHLVRLSAHVSKLVGIFQGRLVFLNHQYWLCTWELGSDEDSYRKHFFLPKDWLLPGALQLVVIDSFGNLLCPKNGEVAIINSEQFSWAAQE
ncbi:hypothetical protein A7D00_0356 [Trichophyton violaceum]|uniref:Uncharacterized protein n=1 Tax=Trichophyton violaceum TaxID=34388 RepID=A0A178FQH8_TRIVO|nr:hypothetical protein A7D00_0356 [Trichophyton violaceum]